MAPAAKPRAGTAAILTGDLVGSTEKPVAALEQAMQALAETARGISAWTGADTRFTRYRGDGWQIYVAVPGLGLRAALTIIARLRAADAGLATRAAIGIGRIDGMGSGDLADGHGPAFETSGHALDRMPRTRRLVIDGDGVTTLHRIVVDLLDERTARWTREQAEAMALHLAPDNPTLTDIAPRLGISPQAVNYRLAGAGGTAIRHALRDWEADFAGTAAGNAA
ncbi:hypothetical protein [Amaricoccus sp.]|uniref:hypothetical protein n=1 Tax=Amaricoccus sp. TaxID=1872485 RepID=UPI0026164D15|nr:hypothetical protein [Amaricoccus sp.]HRO13250.1 hypothetical protein [Amaricoccus sp.]